MLLEFEDISLQGFEEVLLDRAEVLAHLEKLSKIDVLQLILAGKNSRKH